MRREFEMRTKRAALGTMSFLVLVSLVAGACSCDDKKTRGQSPVMEIPLKEDPTGAATYLLEFGEVPVGDRKSERVEITNKGTTELRLQSAPLADPFEMELLPAEGLLIGVAEEKPIRFSFAPREATEEPVETLVTLETNEADKPVTTIRLVGKGVPPGLRCTPNPLEFGKVVRDSERTMTATCANPLNVDLHLATATFQGLYANSFTTAVLSDAGEDGVIIPAQGSLDVAVRFRGDAVGRNDGFLILRDVNTQLLATVELRAETVVSGLLIEPEECLDFGYVELGLSVSRSLRLTNVGNTGIRILDFRFPTDEERAFSVETETPFDLASQSEGREVMVTFQPTAAGLQTSQVEIITDDRRTSATACVSGFGGGPKIVCSPEHHDFGLAALGVPKRTLLRCSNGGEAPAGVSVDPLVIREIASNDPSFSAVLLDDEGQQRDLVNAAFAIGESFLLELLFDPVEEGLHSGKILITTNTNAGVPHETLVTGEGRDLPPCDFDIRPPELNFGVVQRGAVLRLPFRVKNHLDTACLITGVQLTEDSDPFFQMEPVESYELGGHEEAEFFVRFAPTAHQDRVEGAVEFMISNPESPRQTVPLRGVAALPCVIVDPSPVDFGKTGLGCQTEDRAIQILNVCGSPILISEIDVDDSRHGSDFLIRRLPELVLELGPNEKAEMTMRFAPTELGMREALLRFDFLTADGATLHSYAQLQGEGADDLTQRDEFTQLEKPKVDVLWVIDNSGSMAVFQDIIKDRLEIFLTYANRQDIDYQIGVTTTGLFPLGGCPGGADGGENGRLFPVNADSYIPPQPRILTRDTPNLEAAWKRNVKVGTCHGVEQPFEAALRALTPPLVDSIRDPRPDKSGLPDWDDGNAGFLRPDAALSIVVLSDEEDQSYYFEHTPMTYIAALRNVKAARYRDLFKFHAITVPAQANPLPTCGDFLNRGDRLIAGVEATGGVWFNICTPTSDVESWNAGLERISKGVFDYSTSFPLRNRPAGPPGGGPPGPNDIEVWVNGFRVADMDGDSVIWRYDPVANVVEFTALNAPKAGQRVEIVYQVACLQ